MNIGDKKGDNLSEGLSFLNQMIVSLEESVLKLEQAYKKDKYEQLNAIKEFILKLQKRMSDELK
jgi:hypothetical protein